MPARVNARDSVQLGLQKRNLGRSPQEKGDQVLLADSRNQQQTEKKGKYKPALEEDDSQHLVADRNG